MRVSVAAGTSLIAVGGSSVLLAISSIYYTILARRLGLGFFEANFTVPLTIGGLVILLAGILLLALPKVDTRREGAG